MSGVLNLAYILQLVIHGLNNRTLPEHEFVIEIHQRVFHVPLYLGDQMHVVNKQHVKEILADVSPVGKELAEESLCKTAVLQRCPVIDIARRELPLYDFSLVIDDQMNFESVGPSHRAFSLPGQAFHGLVRVHPLDMEGYQRFQMAE